ncbi:MAG: hypothetical protein ACI8W9_000029, partial [Psychromonas sp.]
SAILWSTLGRSERIRVPLPAARITTLKDIEKTSTIKKLKIPF